MNHVLEGEVMCDVIEIRFAYSGRLASVSRKTGDRVARGQIIASLDRKMMQTELDRQLADYERTRAEFELFGMKNTGDDDTTKYLRVQKQASLNASVKDVELSKFKMDMADLTSPVAGVISSMEGLVPGMYVTPASAPVLIVADGSARFVVEVTDAEIADFMEPKNVTVSIGALNKDIQGTSVLPTCGKNGRYTISIMLETADKLLGGMRGSVIAH